MTDPHPMSSRYQPPEATLLPLRQAIGRSLSAAGRAAVALLGQPSPFDVEEALGQLRAGSADELVRELVAEYLDQLVLQAVRARGLQDRMPDPMLEKLGGYARRRAAALIRIDHAVHEACGLLDENDVSHAVFKGALTRAFLYSEPQHRPATDVDLVVRRADVPLVVRLLSGRGYEASLARHSDTHELLLRRGEVLIDLHWSLTRPGRMRHDLAGAMIASRTRYGELWGPSPDYLTAVLLFHPAITDYVTGRLISAVDLDRWLRSRPIAWPAVLAILDGIGLRCAAWAMLVWTHALFATPLPDGLWDDFAISPRRQRYLASWLAHDPAKVYRRHPFLVRTAFSLGLQDRASDVAGALWRLARKERMSL